MESEGKPPLDFCGGRTKQKGLPQVDGAALWTIGFEPVIAAAVLP